MVVSKKPQLNTSLTDRDRWVLDVIAAARGVSAAALVREQVEAFLRSEEDRPAIRRLIRAAEDLRAEDDEDRGSVTPLRPRAANASTRR